MLVNRLFCPLGRTDGFNPINLGLLRRRWRRDHWLLRRNHLSLRRIEDRLGAGALHQRRQLDARRFCRIDVDRVAQDE